MFLPDTLSPADQLKTTLQNLPEMVVGRRAADSTAACLGRLQTLKKCYCTLLYNNNKVHIFLLYFIFFCVYVWMFGLGIVLSLVDVVQKI